MVQYRYQYTKGNILIYLYVPVHVIHYPDGSMPPSHPCIISQSSQGLEKTTWSSIVLTVLPSYVLKAICYTRNTRQDCRQTWVKEVATLIWHPSLLPSLFLPSLHSPCAVITLSCLDQSVTWGPCLSQPVWLSLCCALSGLPIAMVAGHGGDSELIVVALWMVPPMSGLCSLKECFET